jgi:hypothetical protein
MEASWADASRIERVPRMTALTEPVIFLAGRPAAQRAADARRLRLAGLFLFLNLTVRHDGGSISCWTHLFGSLNSLFFGKAAPILSNHMHFFLPESGVLNRHAEQHVLVLLVVRGEGVLMQYDSLNIGGAHPREVRKLLPDGCDQAGLSLHSLLVVHGHVLAQRAEAAPKASPHIMTLAVKTRVSFPREEAHHANAET